MKTKIWFCIALVSFICTFFTAFCGSASTRSSGAEWSISFSGSSTIATGNLWETQSDFGTDLPVFQSSGYTSPPAGYTLIARASRGEDSRNRSLVFWIYAPSGTDKLRTSFTTTSNDIYIYDDFNVGGGDFFILYNITSGNNTSAPSVYTGYHSNYQWSPYYRLTSYIPLADSSGNIITPPDYLRATLNCVTSSHFLFFNTTVDGSFSGNVQYYIFPSSVDLSSNSTLIASGSSAYLTDDDSMSVSFINRGFEWFVEQYRQVAGYGRDFSNNEQFVLYSSDSSYSGTFNPSNISNTYAFIGSAPVGSPAYFDLKSVSRTGVYAHDSLCLVAVVKNTNSYSYSRFDFNIADMLAGTIKPPTSIHNTVTPQQQPVTDLQDLADYLKYLSTVNDGNDTIRDRNFIAMLGSLPWSNYVGSGVGTGLTGWLPKLCSELDNTFNSLFNHWYNPSDNDLQQLINDVNYERNEIRSKLSFNTQVKTEINFVHSSILESGDTPPTFEVPLSVFWSGGSSSENVVVISFDSIPLSVISLIKDVITVFLTLGVISYIWRTLPSTIGNMPSDKG